MKNKNSFSNNFINLIILDFKKILWINFLILYFIFSYKCIAQEKSLEKSKSYLISKSMKFGKDPFKNVFFSADDQHAIILSANSSLEIIRIQNGKRVRVIPSREQEAISLLPHLAAKIAITGGEDETIRIWDTLLTSSKGVLRGHLSPVSHLALFTGGEILASGSLDGTIIFWNIKEQTLLNSAKISGKDGIKSLVFHPEEKILLIGGKNGTVEIRSFPELKLIFNFSAHKKTVTDIEFNNRGDIFVTSSEDGKVIIWDWKDRKSRFSIDLNDAVSDLSIHPRRQEMAVVTTGGKFETWNIEKGTKINEIKKFEKSVSHVQYDNNGRRILTALDDGSIHIWKFMASLYLETLSGHERVIESMDFSKDSKYLISSGSEKSVFIWDLQNKSKFRKFDMGKHRVQEVRFIPESPYFVTAGTNGLIKIWNSEDGKLIRDLKFHKGKINSLSIHPKEKVLLSAGSDRNWVLWDIESGARKLNGSGHSSQILTSTFSPLGSEFATAGSDLAVKIWSFPAGEEIVSFNGHKKAITSLDFSPDGEYLASGSKDNRIIFWKIKPEISNEPYRLLKGHDFIINRVLFSKKGKKLISVSKDKTMRLWEVNSGKLIRILHGDSTPLFSSALSPNGELIALSNLSKDIMLFKFPNEINGLSEKSISSYDNDKMINSNEKESSIKIGGNAIINLDDLQETDSNFISQEELSAYAVSLAPKKSFSQFEKQKRLNQLLKRNNTCLNALEMENLALDILKEIPDDLAAYHSLIKVSILKGDFNILKLLLRAGNFAQLDNERYNYLSLYKIKYFFEKLSVEVFDQSFFRRGNIQKIALLNCKDKSVPLNLAENSLKLYYPKEFLEKLTKKPRLIDFKDFMELNSTEFQNRIFKEINRVVKNGNPHRTSRISMTNKEVTETIPYGIIKINFEKVQTFKGNGKVSFLLRKEGGFWLTYSSDMDNQIVMNLQAGRYYLKVSGILRKTFTLISGTNLNINLE